MNRAGLRLVLGLMALAAAGTLASFLLAAPENKARRAQWANSLAARREQMLAQVEGRSARV